MSCRYDAEQGYLRDDGELCAERHCYACGSAHTDQLTCPRCVGEGRQVLREMGELIGDLPAEAEARGVNSEAMNLLGPTCDAEARGHLEASVAAGRVPADYLDEADDALHPLKVLGDSQMVWADVLDHDLTMMATVSNAIHYLGANLSEMAQSEHITYADDLDAWRKSLGHLRGVLQYGTAATRGIASECCGAVMFRPLMPAKACGHDTAARMWVSMLLDYGLPVWPQEARAMRHPCGMCNQGGAASWWECSACGMAEPEGDYRVRAREAHLREAEWLSGPDCAERFGIKASAVRKWAERGYVAKKLTEGRMLYRVQHIRERMTA